MQSWLVHRIASLPPRGRDDSCRHGLACDRQMCVRWGQVLGSLCPLVKVGVLSGVGNSSGGHVAGGGNVARRPAGPDGAPGCSRSGSRQGGWGWGSCGRRGGLQSRAMAWPARDSGQTCPPSSWADASSCCRLFLWESPRSFCLFQLPGVPWTVAIPPVSASVPT